MDSRLARKLFVEYASGLAYIDVKRPNSDRSIGSAFRVGDGVFVTARHVVEKNQILEIRLPELSRAEAIDPLSNLDLLTDVDNAVSAGWSGGGPNTYLGSSELP